MLVTLTLLPVLNTGYGIALAPLLEFIFTMLNVIP